VADAPRQLHNDVMGAFAKKPRRSRWFATQEVAKIALHKCKSGAAVLAHEGEGYDGR
jgi:hypothetical protein